MLLDETMLPRVKTRIPQMADLLQAEQMYLDVILDMVSWLQGRMILLGEVVMNIPNLKAKIKEITGWECDILEDAENLTLTLRYYFDAQEPVLAQEERILMYVPAHLKVIHEFLQSYMGRRPLYAGAGLGAYIKYTGYPQETGGMREGTVRASVQGGIYVHTKLIAYPEETIDGR